MKKNVFILMIISLLLLIGIYKYIDYLFGVKEGYVDKGTPETSHDVPMPINTTVECKNKCSPAGRCYITGQECMADIDCPGCNYRYGTMKSVPKHGNLEPQAIVSSPLIGNSLVENSSIIKENEGKPPPQAFLGSDIWKQEQGEQVLFYNKRYGSTSDDSKYPKIPSVTGEMTETGPLPSNY